MTEEQTKLVEDNIRLVGHTINKYFPCSNGDKDVYQEGCLGLIDAATNFDESKGYEFSSLAVRCISNRIIKYFRPSKAKKRIPVDKVVSLNNLIFSSKKLNEFDEFMTDSLNVEDNVIRKIIISEVIDKVNKMPKKQAKAFMLYYFNGLNQSEIAKIINVCQMSVSNYLKRANKEIESMMEAI